MTLSETAAEAGDIRRPNIRFAAKADEARHGES